MNVDYITCGDCMELMKELENDSVNLVLTDIPYGVVNRDSNGLRSLDKGKADVIGFDLNTFLDDVYRVCKSTIIIFCGKEQVSDIQLFFAAKQDKGNGTVRQLIWEKTNPSPMNGQHIYLSGIENAIWFKKRGGTFNGFCKNTVFRYPNGRNKHHPTEKNHDLIRELILDNSNAGDVVLDPCLGSGTTALCAVETGRHYIGYEIDEGYYETARKRLNIQL